MATADYPIPHDLERAFCTAIQLVRDWQQRGGAEPVVSYNGVPYPVRSFARHVAFFGDKMPPETYALICSTAGSTIKRPVNQTYEAGGLCLYRLCIKLKARP
jgi:hypothetical protein